MTFDPASVTTMESLYTQGKFWIAFGGVLWTVFRAAKWVKEIKTVDLVKLQMTLDNQAALAARRIDVIDSNSREQTAQIVLGFKENTSSIVREISELRQDFRTFYMSPQPAMVPARARAPRAASAGKKKITRV